MIINIIQTMKLGNSIQQRRQIQSCGRAQKPILTSLGPGVIEKAKTRMIKCYVD